YERAERCYREALAVRARALGRGHPLVAEALAHLGRLYLLRGRRAHAGALLGHALGPLEAAPGAEPVRPAEGLQCPSQPHHARREDGRAGPLLRRALRLAQQRLGRDDARLALLRCRLVGVYCRQGQFDRAGRLLRRTFRSLRRAPHLTPPDLLPFLDEA